MAKKVKSYNEAELIKMFGLKRSVGNNASPSMTEWTNINTELSDWEKGLFDNINKDLTQKISGWNEEMLKMNLISPVLILGHIQETEAYKTYYESSIEATVQNYFLKTKTDMMIASGILEYPETPYFYFQEYISTKLNAGKKVKDPKGDVTAQVLEAFLIAQEKNKNDKPLYGCTVIGKYWEFMIMENRTYCISESYDCTKPADLMQIIAILRKFKEILETRLYKVESGELKVESLQYFPFSIFNFQFSTINTLCQINTTFLRRIKITIPSFVLGTEVF